jgi:hypothetical protein
MSPGRATPSGPAPKINHFARIRLFSRQIVDRYIGALARKGDCGGVPPESPPLVRRLSMLLRSDQPSITSASCLKTGFVPGGLGLNWMVRRRHDIASHAHISPG